MKRGKEMIIKKDGKFIIEEGAEIVFVYKGKKIIVTKHSVKREIERSELSKDQIELLYKRSIDKLLSFDKTFGPYLFFSKSLRQGIIVDYRPDFKDKSDEKHLILVTFLPRGKDKPFDDTEKIILERYIDENKEETYMSQEFLDYIYEIADVVKENEKGYYVAIVEDCEFVFYPVDNMVWDELNYDIFEVE
jgi:hypothetical protein